MVKASFEGIGQWAATFPCDGVKEGQVVKLDTSGKAVPCKAGDNFCGVVLAAGRDGGACSVALGGMAEAACSGDAVALGWSGLAADGLGGVKADKDGRVRLVVAASEDGGTVTFVL